MKRNISIILLSVLSLLFAGCSIQPGTEMMLGENGAIEVQDIGLRHYQEFGGHDWHVSSGTKVRVIDDFRNNFNVSESAREYVVIYVLEGDARNHTFTIPRRYLLPMTATR